MTGKIEEHLTDDAKKELDEHIDQMTDNGFKSMLIPLHPLRYSLYVLLSLVGWKHPISTNLPLKLFLKSFSITLSSLNWEFFLNKYL